MSSDFAEIIYPVAVVNSLGKKAVLNTQDELFQFVTEGHESATNLFKILCSRTQATQEKINPEIFLTEDSGKFITYYLHYKRYGLGIYWEPCDVPAIVIEALDVIQSTFDRLHAEKMRSA